MSELLALLEEGGALEPLDVELARTLCRLANEAAPELALAVALASREVQAGHVCADLARLADTPLLDAAGESLGPRLPALAPWLEQLGRSALVSSSGLADPARPLVLERAHLYLARYYDHELRVAEHLRALAEPPASAAEQIRALPEHASEPPQDLLARLFPSAPSERDLQREAALATRTRRLSVIVGGPGTGKTSTVVKLLALLVHDALSAGRPPPRTLLVAPTGKAAQRLSEAVEKTRAALPIDDLYKQAIETRASTLHRALGPIEGSLTRFRHGPARPLECDLVLLDEASMVDLALMRRFLDAVPAHARVILLGDPDQLASVEAGGVLHDLCLAAAHAESPLASSLSRLVDSYRYPRDSGIAALARAVHAQAAEEALEVLRAGFPDVRWLAPLEAGELARAPHERTRSGSTREGNRALHRSDQAPPSGNAQLGREAREHYGALNARELELRLAALDRFRVLCAHRSGPAGIEQLNPALARALGQRGRGGQSYAGRPILIMQNDYSTQLFNGDVGVIHLEPGPPRELVACFRAAEGRARRIAIARLPAYESAYAMTVHKSQGSEFDEVALVLPERASRILSRELLYTAITRAKRGVTVYANEAVLRAALLQRVERSSGLVDRLAR